MEIKGSLHQVLDESFDEGSEVILAVRRTLASAEVSLLSIETRLDVLIANVARSHVAREETRKKIKELQAWLDLVSGSGVAGTATSPNPDGFRHPADSFKHRVGEARLDLAHGVGHAGVCETCGADKVRMADGSYGCLSDHK